jgi:hypothetical protein
MMNLLRAIKEFKNLKKSNKMRNYKVKFVVFLLMIFSFSFSQQFENNYCDLDCMDQAFELSDPIAYEDNDYEQAYDFFVTVYEHCTATYCASDGSFN